FRRSFRLKILAKRYGISEEDMITELKSRKLFLEDLVKNDVFDYDNVALRLFEFYSRKRYGE
ncbi:MAG: hypothetical protein B6U76_04580, partial [Desulfurococcales archaeon ex4484_217_2]